MKRHTPTPEEIIEAVCRAFRADREAVLSESRKAESVMPREVIAYLMSTRGAMEAWEIGERLGYQKSQVYQCFKRVRGWIWANDDFAFKVWEAEKIILGIREKILVSNP